MTSRLLLFAYLAFSGIAVMAQTSDNVTLDRTPLLKQRDLFESIARVTFETTDSGSWLYIPAAQDGIEAASTNSLLVEDDSMSSIANDESLNILPLHNDSLYFENWPPELVEVLPNGIPMIPLGSDDKTSITLLTEWFGSEIGRLNSANTAITVRSSELEMADDDSRRRFRNLLSDHSEMIDLKGVRDLPLEIRSKFFDRQIVVYSVHDTNDKILGWTFAEISTVTRRFFSEVALQNYFDQPTTIDGIRFNLLCIGRNGQCISENEAMVIDASDRAKSWACLIKPQPEEITLDIGYGIGPANLTYSTRELCSD